MEENAFRLKDTKQNNNKTLIRDFNSILFSQSQGPEDGLSWLFEASQGFGGLDIMMWLYGKHKLFSRFCKIGVKAKMSVQKIIFEKSASEKRYGSSYSSTLYGLPRPVRTPKR